MRMSGAEARGWCEVSDRAGEQAGRLTRRMGYLSIFAVPSIHPPIQLLMSVYSWANAMLPYWSPTPPNHVPCVGKVVFTNSFGLITSLFKTIVAYHHHWKSITELGLIFGSF